MSSRTLIRDLMAALSKILCRAQDDTLKAQDDTTHQDGTHLSSRTPKLSSRTPKLSSRVPKLSSRTLIRDLMAALSKILCRAQDDTLKAQDDTNCVQHGIMFIALPLLLFFAVPSYAQTVQAFGLVQAPFSNQQPGDQLCYLNLVQVDMARINAEVRQNHETHLTAIKARYQQDFAAMGQAEKCRWTAYELGVTQLPAVVFDKKYVVYGTTDLREARGVWVRYRMNQGAAS